MSTGNTLMKTTPAHATRVPAAAAPGRWAAKLAGSALWLTLAAAGVAGAQSMVITQGDKQTGAVDTILIVPLGVRISGLGNVDRQAVDWQVAGSGTLTATSTNSVATGDAYDTLSCGSTPGTLTATATLRAYPGVHATFTATCAAPQPPILNYQGLWWKSPAESESGWGMNLAHQGNVIFMTWFTYDTTGKGAWLVMIADAYSDGSYAGRVYQTRGPAFNSVPFNPLLVHSTALGVGSLKFSDANNGAFTYTFVGSSGTLQQTLPITRQIYGPPPTCTYNAQPNLALAVNYQDLWWAAPVTPGGPPGPEAGWGINLTHQGDTIFATWFTYDYDGTPRWLVVTAPKTAPGTYSGTLYRTTGTPFGVVWDPARFAATVAGTASFTFADGNSAAFAYTVDSVTQTKQITREVLRGSGTECR